MKILFIKTIDDYGASIFEEEIGLEKAKEMIANNQPIEHESFESQILEFEQVDLRFIDFIKNELQDYDDSKHTNFYVLEN